MQFLREPEQGRKDASGKIFAISFSELLQGLGMVEAASGNYEF